MDSGRSVNPQPKHLSASRWAGHLQVHHVHIRRFDSPERSPMSALSELPRLLQARPVPDSSGVGEHVLRAVADVYLVSKAKAVCGDGFDAGDVRR